MSSYIGRCTYGTRFLVPGENAFNPCFIELLIFLNGLILVPFGLAQLWFTISKKAPGKIKINKISSVGILRLLGVIVQGGLLFRIDKLYLLVNAVLILAIALPLAFLELFKSPIVSGSLIFYWLFQVIFFIAAVAQNYFTDFKVADDTVFLKIALANALHLFISTSFFYKPVHEVLKVYIESGVVQANALSKITFYWMNDLIGKGYREGKINESDLPTPPARLDPRAGYEALNKVWVSQKKKSLLFALIRVFGFTVLTAVFYELLDDILSFAEPQLLRLLIKFFNGDEPYIVGFLIAAGMFFVSVLETTLGNKFFMTIYEAGLGTRSALMTLLYHKALQLSPESKKDYSTGDIINLMAVDVNRVQDLCNQFQSLVSIPIKLVLCLVSLYTLLGKSSLAGLGVMIIMIPLNSFLSQRINVLYEAQMKFKDNRTRVTSEMLSSIKSIKLYAIEEAILEKLNHVRNVLELGNFKKIGVVTAFMSFSWNSVPFLVSCSTFFVFALIEERPLTPDIIFPALSLFNLLGEPIQEIPLIVTSLIETSVALQRITKILLSEEIDEDLIKHYERVNAAGNTAVRVSNATFYWEAPKKHFKDDYDEESATSEAKVALKIDNFEAKKAELTCIVGKVGSGKSTFLQAILGQLPCAGSDGSSPNIEVHGSVAYCAQVPWILNASVKDNILFGHRFDNDFYQKTIEACQLLPDLEILPDGDETQVGEKGISLSGGQKARLSLARAVYARADVYLLDDILSAVDAHVGRSLITQVLNGLLVTKTIILATNSIPVLNHAETIILLSGGQVVETGSFKDILGSGSKISALINDFGANFDMSKASSEETSIDENTLEERKPSDASSRRASIASMKRQIKNNKSKRTAQQEEQSAIGSVDFSVYKAYAKACSYTGSIGFILLCMLAILFSITGSYVLKVWSEFNDKNGSNKDVYKFVGLYSFFGLGSGVFILFRTIVLWVYCSVRASVTLHDRLAKAVIRSPMSFFETTPIGRVMNRFSTDVNRLDEGLARVFTGFFTSILRVIFTLGFIGITMPSFVVVIFALSFVYLFYQRYYVGTSRDLKRIVNVSRSPIFAHLQESLSGYETIRAYNQQSRFEFLHISNLEFNLKSLYIFRSINRWLSVRLQFVGSLIIFTTASMAITHDLSPGMAGLVISYALRITSSLSFFTKMSVEVETNIVSVERILDYCELKPEADEITDLRPPENWPSDGSVKFDSYSARYRENLDLVLKEVTLDIKPREKIGIVGRTGAGKSTLSLALFRLIEPASGRILIDGLDSSKLGLRDLRGNLAIIPQDSQAFEGTVRQNLDPLGSYTDEELWRALELSHLKSFIQELDKNDANGNVGLEAKLSEGGSNLSVGQRQLLCLARALLNPSKVLILDEATASVDVETDQIVQKTIREVFNDRTILTIAHRIDTVMDSDRIVVLERGEVKEFDSPENLLKDKESLFYHLCSQGGYIDRVET